MESWYQRYTSKKSRAAALLLAAITAGSLGSGLAPFSSMAPALARHHAGQVNTALDKAAPDAVITVKDISYVADANSTTQRLDMYIPIGYYNAHNKKPLPVVVYIHGGGFVKGDKSRVEPKQFLDAGFIICSVNYRLSPAGTYPASLYDVKAAIRWLRAHKSDYFLDDRRICAWGTSAGGYFALMLGTTAGAKDLEGNLGNDKFPSDVQAVCAFSAPSDFDTIVGQRQSMDGKDGKNSQIPGDAEIEKTLAEKGENSTSVSVRKLLGYSPASNLKAAAKASPINFISKSDPPMLLVHGEKDTIVPFAQSKEFAARLAKCGVQHEVITFPDCGHTISHFEGAVSRMIDFFKRTVK